MHFRPIARPRTLRSRLLIAGAAGLLTATVTPFTATADPATPCGTGGVLTTSPFTCDYTAVGTDTFTVPDGVTAVSIDLFGAEGGSAAGFVAPNPPNAGAPGGLGGETRATLAVRAGQVLRITLGAAGSSGTSRHGEYARPGGVGHGAGGGGAHGGGGSGGGGSDVRVDGLDGSDRVLVAGGGGGAGNGGPQLRGGDGGGPAGGTGGQSGVEGAGLAGAGGTGTAPGAGSPNSRLGGPGVAGSDSDPDTGLPNPGSGGPGGNGGRGGNGGGGGGGGNGGGAGGFGGGNPGNLPGAGGGGGSSFAAPTATGVALLPGVNHGNGRAVVSFRYGTLVSLTPDTSTPLFGHSVTVTATVASAVGAPNGTVTFSDGTTPLATVPLTAGQAAFSTGGFQPGAHAITAHYDGDAGFVPSATTTDLVVGFSRPCLTTAHHGPLTVAADEALCIAAGGTQNGPVTVRPGGSLAIADAAVTGPLTSDGALALTICRSTLTGPVSVGRTSGHVLLGSDPAHPTACGGNTIRGPLTLNANTGCVQTLDTTVTGPVRVTGPRSGSCD
ncbi:hypothetical protein GCM10009664_56450 [Kitasatospora gansuensis]